MHMKLLARSVTGFIMLLSLLPALLRAQESTMDAPVVMEELVYSIKGKDTLALDYYHPAADSLRNKYLVIFVHGGGFSGGSRREEANSYFSRQLATFGYQSASISYRLTAKGKGFGCNRPAAEKLETFKAAVEDVYDATEYFRQRAKRAGQDSLHIILAGSSAGAEAILHAVYWPEKILAPPSSPLPAGYRYAGIISMAGALADTSQINRTMPFPACSFMVPKIIWCPTV
jgi:acetyl esterase/lipase